jgi:hypothetical protein
MLQAYLHTVLDKDIFSEESIGKQVFFIHDDVIIVFLRNDLIVLQVRSNIPVGKTGKLYTSLGSAIMICGLENTYIPMLGDV